MKKITQEQIEEKKNTIIQLRTSGKTLMDIAKQVDVSDSSVFNVLRRYAPHLLGPRSRYEEIRDQVIADFKTGLSCSSIARNYDISAYFVKKIVEQKKVTRTGKIRYQRQPTPEEQAQKISRKTIRRESVLELHQKGYTCLEIANSLHAHYLTVRRDMHLLKLTPHRKQNNGLKKDRNDAIIKDRRNGKTIADLAKQFGISKQRVSAIILEYNKTTQEPIIMHMGKWRGESKQSQKFWETIIQWYHDGMTLGQIADKLNIRYNSLRQQLYKFRNTSGKILWETVRADDILLDKILALRKTGMSLTAIAKQLSVSEMTIQQRLKKAGIKFV
ncbi:MAG: hypothetical protein LBU34_07605 [Planctomycetaceae bacterium]|jgi:transposase|nr:hypothetical protein [Planctomycetaceae bacterium]